MDAFLVITSAPSFHGSSHDLWLINSFPLFLLVCFVCIVKIFVPRVFSLQSLTLGTRFVICSSPLNLVSDTGHKSAPLWFILTLYVLNFWWQECRWPARCWRWQPTTIATTTTSASITSTTMKQPSSTTSMMPPETSLWDHWTVLTWTHQIQSYRSQLNTRRWRSSPQMYTTSTLLHQNWNCRCQQPPQQLMTATKVQGTTYTCS